MRPVACHLCQEPGLAAPSQQVAHYRDSEQLGVAAGQAPGLAVADDNGTGTDQAIDQHVYAGEDPGPATWRWPLLQRGLRRPFVCCRGMVSLLCLATCSDLPAGIPAALAASCREVTPETLPQPIGHEPSTSMSRLPRVGGQQTAPCSSGGQRAGFGIRRYTARRLVSHWLHRPLAEIRLPCIDTGDAFRSADVATG